MKVTESSTGCKDGELKYPCLLQGKGTNSVYYATSRYTGVGMTGLDKGRQFNSGCTFLVNATSSYLLYHGSICLEND